MEAAEEIFVCGSCFGVLVLVNKNSLVKFQ